MSILKKYFSFSKILVFTLILAFFGILAFDGFIIMKLIDMIYDGYDLMYAGVIGTIVGTMSTFSNAVILFAVKGYLSKAGLENSVGYDAKTNTISEERIKQMMSNDMEDPSDN